MSGIDINTAEVAPFSPQWWKDAAAIVDAINYYIRDMNTQLTQVMNTTGGAASEHREIVSALTYLIEAKEAFDPMKIWVHKAKELALPEISSSEQTALNSICEIFEYKIDYATGQLFSPMDKVICTLIANNTMLGDTEKAFLRVSAENFDRNFKNLRTMFYEETF